MRCRLIGQGSAKVIPACGFARNSRHAQREQKVRSKRVFHPSFVSARQTLKRRRSRLSELRGVVRSCRYASAAFAAGEFVLEAPGLAAGFDDVGAVGEPIDDRLGEARVGEEASSTR